MQTFYQTNWEHFLDRVRNHSEMISFSYHGVRYWFDPLGAYFAPEYLFMKDGEETRKISFKSGRDFLNAPLVEGKSIREVADDVEILDL